MVILFLDKLDNVLDNTHIVQFHTFAIRFNNNYKQLQMSTIQFIGVNPSDLITELKNSLIPELKAQLSAQFQPIQPTEYLTRSEVCKLLKIDLSTLHRWRKDKMIPSYGFGNRVYFKRNEVEQIINQNKLS